MTPVTADVKLKLRAFLRPSLPPAVFLGVGAVLAYGYYRRSYRYRDPVRLLPEQPGLIAPVDGRVERLTKQSDGWQLTLRLSPLSVRYVYAPQDGQVTALGRLNGGLAYDMNLAATQVLRLTLGQAGESVEARSYFSVDDAVRRGNKLAFLERGSTVQLHFGPDLRPSVTLGDWVTGGQTVVAQVQG